MPHSTKDHIALKPLHIRVPTTFVFRGIHASLRQILLTKCNEFRQATFSTAIEATRRTGRQQTGTEAIVVDRIGLEVLGFLLGGVTAVVFVIAVLVVRSHLEDKVPGPLVAVASASASFEQ